MVLESANGALLVSIVAMHIWKHKLVGYFPLLFVDAIILCANLIVEDLKIGLVAVIDVTMHNGVSFRQQCGPCLFWF